jgi:putative GTP pyrophosphokinase
MEKEKKAKGIDLESLEIEYKSLLPIGTRFCLELVNQINKLIENQGIVLGFPIQHRVKKWESLAEKFERVFLNIKSIKEIQDIFGLRIILLFRRDVEKVSKLVTDNFSIVKHYDTLERLQEDQFGYSSIHEVIKLPDAWLSLPTLAEMGGLTAEIQIRTVAQHIWAEASHNLQYKQEENVPASVRRSIYRVSALLETVDLEFERVLEERESYRTDIDISEPKEELNVDLLEKILDSKLPSINKKPEEHYSELLNELLHFGINNTNDLNKLLDKHFDEAIKEDKKSVDLRLKEHRGGKELYGTTLDRIEKGVFFTHVGLTRVILSKEFGEEQVREYRKKIKKKK